MQPQLGDFLLMMPIGHAGPNWRAGNGMLHHALFQQLQPMQMLGNICGDHANALAKHVVSCKTDLAAFQQL